VGDNPFDFDSPTAGDDYEERQPAARFRARGRRGPATTGWMLLFLSLAMLLLVLLAAACFWPLAIVLVIAYLVLHICAVAWTAADGRGEVSAGVWVIAVLIGGPLGLLAYLVQR
jgi:hypothetical protein